MCNHKMQVKETKNGVLTYTCQECKSVLHAIKVCSVCGDDKEVALYHIGGQGYKPFCVGECK